MDEDTRTRLKTVDDDSTYTIDGVPVTKAEWLEAFAKAQAERDKP